MVLTPKDEKSLNKNLKVLNDDLESKIMRICQTKTKTITTGKNVVKHSIKIGKEQLQVNKFKYLGFVISQDG